MVCGMDVYFEVIDVEECVCRYFLIFMDNLVGGFWDFLDGDIDFV